MNFFFKNTLNFSILYLLDSFFKNTTNLLLYRYISKTLLSFSLLFFHLINTTQEDSNKKKLIIISLCCFLIGDVFFIAGNNGNMIHFILASSLFILSKVCYSIRFFNNKDFKISKLIPFLLFCFCYMSIIIAMVYNQLGLFLLPLLIYLFVIMLFSYLRKNEVNSESFWFVILGVITSMVAGSLNILKKFNSLKRKYV